MVPWLRNLPLRSRLVLAFLAVSVIPVLLASYVAAASIENSFRRNIGNWLDEAVRFLVSETLEARQDAEKAADILAGTMSGNGPDGALADTGARPFAELLVSTGYDLVQVFAKDGRSTFSFGPAQLNQPPPLVRSSAILIGKVNAQDAMMIGAISPFMRGGEENFVFIANLIDTRLFGMSRALSTLDVGVMRVENGVARPTSDTAAGAVSPVPARVIEKLAAGEASLVDAATPGGGLTAYGALRGAKGELVGIVTCRIGARGGLFQQINRIEIFALLAALSGLLSFLVAVLVANWIVRPLRDVSRGVAAVAAGNYDLAVREQGGPEFVELAAGFNSMVSQLSRLRAMEADMRKRQQFAALGEAAAVIAHEIRNPLGIMKTSADVVKLRGNLSPESARLIGFMLDEIARIDRLVDDILDYVRPARGSVEHVDMAALTRDVTEALRETMLAQGIQLQVDIASTPLPMRGMKDRLKQLLLNLALNARDAMAQGGSLSLSCHARGREIEVQVSDTGIGIKAEDLARIYDPFFTTKARGTGLGLAKAAAIVDEHGGRMSCRSEAGKGTSFTLVFPMDAGEGA